jgi:choline dehydrogenase-like flavoprotein
MIFDANEIGRDRFDQEFDVCVVGSGPAGVALARRLAASGRHVALMEAGGLEISPEAQDPYLGENIGLDYFDPFISRLRYFGGSSNHWDGRCRELDAHDFEPRPGNPLSGWPITKSDLDPYAGETAEILALPPEGVFSDTPLPGGNIVEIRYRRSRPVVRIGRKYHDEIAASDRIHLFLNASLVDLTLDDNLATVTEAIFRSYAGEDSAFAVRARAYALCMGGLENPRFLLNATRQVTVGIGNGHDLVGRFFCEHPHFFIGDVIFEGTVPPSTAYAATHEYLQREEVLNFAVRMSTESRVFHRELARSAICVTPFTERLAAEVLGWSIECERFGIADYMQRWWDGTGDTGLLQVNTEQALNRDSRILLTDETDDFGHRRLAQDWRLNALDYKTMRAAATTFGSYVADAGIGRLRIREWLLDETLPLPGVGDEMPGGYHHMCTTRMSADPREGVVDADCRVHGTSNLYVGGSSVFATPGHANPTYSIVQLALRLGDHLTSQTA